MMNLRRNLTREREEHKLISIGALQRLVTESSVQERLSSAEIPLEPGLVSRIVSRCPKIFAILVLLELEHYITKPFIQGLSDRIFPVTSNDVPAFESKKNRVDFYETQWCIPSQIDVNQHLELDRHAMLPYFRMGDQRNGAWGLVDKVNILEGHLAGWPEGEPIAVKKIKIEDGRPQEISFREIDTLRKRQHKNIVKLLASYTETREESGQEQKFLHLMFPWAEKDMDEWMKMKYAPDWLLRQTRDEQRKYLYTVLYDLISALAYLHKEIEGKLTSHHDLKPNNILVYREKLVIADLGCSHLRSIEMGSETEGKYGLGTYEYQPPECWKKTGIFAGGYHGRSFDVWAMGCIMIDVAILISYGWESEKVMQFRAERKGNPIDNRQFENQRFKGYEDASFHNNMNVVEKWLMHLRGDGSNQLKKTLDLIASMLDLSPEKRPYSWEAKLNMYEILHPDASDEDRRKVCEETVPRPPKKKLKNISTPLHRAASEGDSTRAEILVERGWLSGTKDAKGYTPAQLAQQSGHQQLGRFLSRSETRNGPIPPQGIRRLAMLLQTPLEWRPIHNSREEDLCSYVKENDLPHAQGLLNRHSSLKIDCVHKISGFQDTTTNYLHDDPFLPDCYSASALHWTLFNETTAIAQLLLNKNADVNRENSFGVTPLHMAALRGKIDFVKFFHSHGADIDSRDNFGQTPLFCAAFSGEKAIIKWLLSQKADVNATDKDGISILHNAVRWSKKNLVKQLLQANANIDAENHEGHTALHFAVLQDDLKIVSLLLAKQANLNVKNKAGISPLHIAVDLDKRSCVQRLLQSGANVNIRNQYEETVLFAVKSKNVYEELVRSGADINAKDVLGRTMPRQFR